MAETKNFPKKRRCLKFTGYIYVPDGNQADYNTMRYYASRTPGRLILCDEYGKPMPGKAFAFDNLGTMMNIIEKTRRKMVYSRVKRQKKVGGK
jgi:hypothetical protein